MKHESNNRTAPARGLRLAHFSDPTPNDLEAVLLELGRGDNRFSGTSFGRGECSLQAFLEECRDTEEGRNLRPHKVPQTTYWVVNQNDCVVGLVRVRHRLNDRLLQYGGHIGYYIRPSERGKGYGKEALRLALRPLARLGVNRALLTVNPTNTHSVRVVLANGGVQDGQGTDLESGEVVNQYWIELPTLAL